MRKIGISCRGFTDLTQEEYVRWIAKVGFDCTFDSYRESEQEQRRNLQLFRQYGLSCESLHAPYDHINDMWTEGTAGDKMLERLKDAVYRCTWMEAPVLVVHLASGIQAPHLNDVGMNRFEKLIAFAQENNVRIAAENQRKLANLAWILERFGEDDGVGFCWDCGHEFCFTNGRHYMPLFGDRVIALHLHDNHGIFNRDEHLLPFDGAIDFSHVADEIRRSGYQGSIMLEVNRGAHYSDISAEAYFTRAAEAARKLRAMVDGSENG